MKFEKIFFNEIDSTQIYLTEKIKSGELLENTIIVANFQTNGIGSRGNKWESEKGNLYFSFSIKLSDIPKDLKINSCSIYFAKIMQKALEKFGKNPWVKWPNDIYEKDKKVGGVISAIVDKMVVCGIGINLLNPPKNAFGYEDIDKIKLLDIFLKMVCKYSWNEIFKDYKKDFEKSREFYFNLGDKRVSLQNACLYQDGSILLENQRIYSLR